MNTILPNRSANRPTASPRTLPGAPGAEDTPRPMTIKDYAELLTILLKRTTS